MEGLEAIIQRCTRTDLEIDVEALRKIITQTVQEYLNVKWEDIGPDNGR